MTAPKLEPEELPEEPDYLHSQTGIMSWINTRDHKRIAVMFFVAVVVFFMIGGVFALLFRTELLTPDRTIMDAVTYNRLFTWHGIVMVWLFLIPSIPNIFGNFVLPM